MVLKTISVYGDYGMGHTRDREQRNMEGRKAGVLPFRDVKKIDVNKLFREWKIGRQNT